MCKTTNLLYIATICCVMYLIVSWISLFVINGRASADSFAVYFISIYKGFLTGIPIFTLHLFSGRLLRLVPVAISKCISYKELQVTTYFINRKNFSSLYKAVAQSSCYFLMGYAIFSIIIFGTGRYEDVFLKIYSCFQIYSVCYVARKLYHLGRMLESIRNVEVNEDIFVKDKLSDVVVMVNIFTFSMIVSLMIHTIVHYNISYHSDILDVSALKFLVITPVLLILPVLVLFNFQPRSVVNSLYRRSIDMRRNRLSSLIERSGLTEVEKQKQLIDYEKFLRDELRYHYRLIFTEAPVILTIVFSIMTVLVRIV